jgi:NADP-dependent 3-hydroxy acid dehydrogenase YdfG
MSSRRVALVTGGSSDIGQAISIALAGAGTHVIAVGRSRERLAELATHAPELIEPVAADLTRDDERSVVAQAASRAERLDMLVLGSGIYERSHDPSALRRQFAANVEAPYALLQTMLPMLKAASGQVVFINSTQGLTASPDVGQYAATQHAMRAIADSLRDEVNASGVRVTSIFLGRTATARQAQIFAMEGRPYPPERLIQPTDLAGVVLTLLTLPPTVEATNISLRPRLKT